MKLFLKIIIGVVVFVFLVVAGIFVYQKIKATQEPGRTKFSIEATILSIDSGQKRLVVNIISANKTLKEKESQNLTLSYSDQGTIKDKSGQYIELINLSTGTKIDVKGTILDNEYVAEYIIEK